MYCKLLVRPIRGERVETLHRYCRLVLIDESLRNGRIEDGEAEVASPTVRSRCTGLGDAVCRQRALPSLAQAG
jgi:hypothetical protein